MPEAGPDNQQSVSIRDARFSSIGVTAEQQGPPECSFLRPGPTNPHVTAVRRVGISLMVIGIGTQGPEPKCTSGSVKVIKATEQWPEWPAAAQPECAEPGGECTRSVRAPNGVQELRRIGDRAQGQ